jgi:hypothetical protein
MNGHESLSKFVRLPRNLPSVLDLGGFVVELYRLRLSPCGHKLLSVLTSFASCEH